MKSTLFTCFIPTWVVAILIVAFAGTSYQAKAQSCPNNCLVTSSFLGNTIYGFDAATYTVLGQSTNTGCGLSGTYDMDIGPDGNLYVVSSISNQIFKYTSSGTCIGQFIGPGNGLSDPRGLLFMADGSLLVTCYDNGGANGRILRYNGTTGAFIGNFSTGADVTPTANIGPHMGIVLGPDGAVWVADYKNDRVLRFDATTGAFLSVFQQFAGSTGTRDIIFPPDGMLYISFRDASKVSRYNYTTGNFIDDLATSAQNLYLTGGMTWGADGLLYIGNVGSLPSPLLNGNIAVIDPVTKALITNIPANTPKRVIFQCGVCFSSTCALTASGKSLETCNNNSTGSNPADDYITFSLNPTGSNLGATYSVTASGGATVTLAAGGAATGIAYGSATAFRLQNGSANGTLYTITITDVNGAPCAVTTTVQQNSCSTTCALTASGESLETCNNNSTGSNPADDYITFSLNPTGSNLGATYSVTASGGATVTLAAGGAATGIAYGSATAFRLQNGSANGTLYTITITDVNGAPCTVTTTVQQNSCSTTCALTASGKSLETCNNNSTGSNPADDYITFSLNPTGSNLGTHFK